MAKILLEKILNEREITYRQAELMTGIPKSTLLDIAHGKSDPRLSTLEQIAEWLKINITDLFESRYK